MGAYSRLKKYTRVPARQNLRGFRSAIAQLTTRHAERGNWDAPRPTADLEKTYARLVGLVLSAQPNSSNLTNLTNQTSAAATSLAAQAIYFHLNFFKPSFLDATRPTDFQKLLKELLRLFNNKNKDYGNSFRFWGAVGLLVRLGDKTFRLRQLSRKNYHNKVAGERIPDTALDLANYALMLLMLLNEGRSLKFGE